MLQIYFLNIINGHLTVDIPSWEKHTLAISGSLSEIARKLREYPFLRSMMVNRGGMVAVFTYEGLNYPKKVEFTLHGVDKAILDSFIMTGGDTTFSRCGLPRTAYIERTNEFVLQLFEE